MQPPKEQIPAKCKCGREICPLKKEWLKVMKLYNENIAAKTMADHLHITLTQLYKYQRKAFHALGLPTIAHAVLHCGKHGCI